MRIICCGSIILSTFAVLTGCGGSNGEAIECPDAVHYDDPLVTITSVLDSSTNEPLAQVKLSNIVLENLPINFNELSDEHLNRVDIVDEGESAICTLPCSLLTSEGEYSMEVSATAYASKIITFDAQYENFDTSACPSTYSGSYELAPELDPAF